MHALRMQRTYAEEENHLSFDYATHVRKIWIKETLGFEPKVDKDDIDLSLLAPAILTAESSVVDYERMSLDGCLEYAWNSRVDSNINHEYSPPPWNTNFDIEEFGPP